MLKVLETSPLRLLAVILFMLVALPSQKALGAEAPMTVQDAKDYLDKLSGPGDYYYANFNEAKIRKAAGVIGGDQDKTNKKLISFYQKFIGALRDDLKKHEFLKTYKNNEGKTLLHQLRDLNGMHGFFYTVPVWMSDEGLFKGVNGLLNEALQEKDGEGKTPLDGVDVNDMILSKIIVINPRLLTVPTSSDGITPLIRLVLTLKEESETKRDELYKGYKEKLKGTTIDFSEADRLIAANIDRVIGEKLTLDDTIWKTIPNHPYNKVRLPKFDAYDFYNHALSIVGATDRSNPLYNIFWQQDAKKSQEANKLWQGYFDESDRLDAERTKKEEAINKKEPLHVRVLKEFSGSNLDPTLKETALKNMISTGGTFGINFKRTAKDLTFNEIDTMKAAIRVYVIGAYTPYEESIDKAKDKDGKLEHVKKVVDKIKADLMPSPEKFEELNLRPECKLRLANHQMTCTALALENILSYAPLRLTDSDKTTFVEKNFSASVSIGSDPIQTDYAGRILRFNKLSNEKRKEDREATIALRKHRENKPSDDL